MDLKKWAPVIVVFILITWVGAVAAQRPRPPKPPPAPAEVPPEPDEPFDDPEETPPEPGEDPPEPGETPPLSEETPPPRAEEEDEELTDEQGMAPLAPFKAPKFKAMERFEREEEEEERKERERRASRPRVVPGVSTGEITPVTLADLKERGETHISQLVLLKVYFMGKGRLSPRRFEIPKGSYQNFRVRDRDLEILNLIWWAKEKANDLRRMKRNTRITLVAKVIDVHTMTDQPILLVEGLKKGWQWGVEAFLPEGEEPPPVAFTPGPDEEIPGETPEEEVPGAEPPVADVPGADVPGADVPGADVPGADTPGEEPPPPDDSVEAGPSVSDDEPPPPDDEPLPPDDEPPPPDDEPPPPPDDEPPPPPPYD